MTFSSYFSAPLMFRYGMWSGLEAYCVVPFVWGESDQRYVNTALYETTEIYSGEISGADLGDFSGGLKWRFWEGDFVNELVLHAGLGFPLFPIEDRFREEIAYNRAMTGGSATPFWSTKPSNRSHMCLRYDIGFEIPG